MKKPQTLIGKRLRVARVAASLSQAEVESALNLARNSVSALETGPRAPRADVLARLARLYGVDVAELAALCG